MLLGRGVIMTRWICGKKGGEKCKCYRFYSAQSVSTKATSCNGNHLYFRSKIALEQFSYTNWYCMKCLENVTFPSKGAADLYIPGGFICLWNSMHWKELNEHPTPTFFLFLFFSDSYCLNCFVLFGGQHIFSPLLEQLCVHFVSSTHHFFSPQTFL